MSIRKIIRFLLFVFVVLSPGKLLADVEEDGAIWFNVNAQGKLPVENLNWYAELQPRWRGEGDHLDLLILRPGIFYKLSPKSSVWGGMPTSEATQLGVRP